jgi:hypothetical protein
MNIIEALGKVAKDSVTGIGVVKDVKMQEQFAKADKKKEKCIGYRYSLEISKLNAVLSLDLSEEMYTRLCAEVATEAIVKDATVLSYEAEISVEADAFAWKNDSGSGAMATSKYNTPFLTNYKKVS